MALDIMTPLDKSAATPLYLQLQTVLREAIARRAVDERGAIPTERDLARGFDVSRITVRKAVDGLVREGLLTRRAGAGTFVRGERVQKSFSTLSSFSEDMQQRGFAVRSVWISRKTAAVTPEEALALGLSPGTLIHRFNRIRYADDEPLALELATIPVSCLPSTDLVTDSLYAALDAQGQRPVRALQRLRAVAFTSEQARVLNVEPGAPGLFIERRGFQASGLPCEFTQSYYRGDAYDVVAELQGT
ncbi:GntR family transcriptional regulator [Parvularcula sp. LCG005]|uniref:GntR family transcriptional regulator n=1 Tax=Parvularcula sp. LCG005 TaxID=3078805 RepID=UPI002942140C|nr:GntR family transcriptional regulator [Parvularcula sp. LCG005]WOI53649.1 GntR family transcriptional regulator [Parvularcula sp. LCG005]